MEEMKNTGSCHGKNALKYLLRILGVFFLTVALIVAFLYSAMLLVCRGPSESARDLFVLSVRETSAIGFLANLVLSDAEIEEIVSRPQGKVQETDTSLIAMNSVSDDDSSEPKADEWGYVDDDGDGIIIVPVAGEGYIGKMMIVLDPSRVIVGCAPELLGTSGCTVEEFALREDAVAAINGGGFMDLNGGGNGSIPDTCIVSRGQVYYGGSGVGPGFVGIDSNYILHVGFTSSEQIEEWDIQEGVGYGPVLVANGEPQDTSGALVSGLNPRTAIGQRSDGAILMLVIDGRQPSSIGATYTDEVDIMLKFGAVNACNLDGGSSSLMWYNGEYINNCASVIGIRDIPSSFVVLKEGRS